MQFKSENKHMVDILFVLALFSVFTISALLLVILGADVYSKTIDDMDQNFTTRTSFSYITEKIRQADRTGAVEIGTFDGQDALILSQSLDDTVYCTYIYLYNGHLKELFIKKGQDIQPKAGQDIIALTSFHLEQMDDHLYRLTMKDATVSDFSLIISTHSN
jgi:hypothetical protein